MLAFGVGLFGGLVIATFCFLYEYRECFKIKRYNKKRQRINKGE